MIYIFLRLPFEYLIKCYHKVLTLDTVCFLNDFKIIIKEYGKGYFKFYNEVEILIQLKINQQILLKLRM